MRKLLWLLLLVSASCFGQAVGGGGVPGAGTGSGGTPCTGVVNGIQYNNAGAFGCNAALIFNPSTGVLTATGFATSGATQGFIVLQQVNSAAPTQPANSYELLAPQSGLTSSYQNIVPLLAPTANNSVMASPNGGGQMTWVVPALLSAANTFTASNTFSAANTFNAEQTISFSTSGVNLNLANTIGTSGAAIQFTPSGEDAFQNFAGGSGFAPNWFVVFDSTNPTSITAFNHTVGLWNSSILPIGWGSGGTPGALDTAISRGSAGVLDVGTGANGDHTGTVSAGGFTAGGSAGVTKTCGATIVVTGGIITSC